MATDWSNVRPASGANVDQAQSVLSWGRKGQGTESPALFRAPCVN